MRVRTRALPLLASACLLLVTPTHASTIIYDTFLPNDQWSGGGFGVESDPDIDIGVSFVPFSSGYLTELWIAASVSVTNRGGDMDVTLWSDNDGVPGEVLWQIPVVDQLVHNQTTPLVLEAPGSLFLSEDEQYWLTISPHEDNWIIWHNMSLGFEDLPPYLGTGIARAPDINDGNWFITGNNDNVFRIYAEPTASAPTPASALLFLLGLGVLLIARRHTPLSS